LPKKFDSESKALSQNVIPGAAAMPGSAYVLVRELDDEAGQKAPCIVSIMAVPKAEQKAEQVQSMLAKGMSAVAPGAKWEDVQVATPSGQQLTLKRLRMDVPMPVPDAKGKATTVPSRIDMYHIEGGSNTVMITWLTPQGQRQKHNL